MDNVFSPDSKRVAYGARLGEKMFVVVDGVEGKEYYGIGKEYYGIVKDTLVFSPDSNRIAYGATRGGKSLVVVDGVEGKEYDDIVKGSRLVFDSPTKLHTLAIRDKELFLVEIEITEP
jgi:hypothetical protein